MESITPIAKVKTTMLKSSLCDFSDACILVKGTIKITGLQKFQLFMDIKKMAMKKSIALSLISIENSKILKYHTFSIKH